MVLGCLDTQLRLNATLEDAVHAVNLLLYEKGSGRFVTLFLLQLDTRGRGRFVSAGHNPAFVYRAGTGRISDVGSNSPLLGVFERCSIRSEEIEMERGDVILVYSDGLTEAENARREMLGEDQVREIMRHNSEGTAESLRTSILQRLERFTEGHSQSDDITFMILKRR